METAKRLDALAMNDVSELWTTINRKIVGVVGDVEEVRAKKRVKYSISPPLVEPDYKKAFNDLHNHISEYLGVYVCINCTYLDEEQKRRFVMCEACQNQICLECLPNHERDDDTIRNIFYCNACTEHGAYEMDLLEEDSAYQRIKVINGGIHTVQNKIHDENKDFIVAYTPDDFSRGAKS